MAEPTPNIWLWFAVRGFLFLEILASVGGYWKHAQDIPIGKHILFQCMLLAVSIPAGMTCMIFLGWIQLFGGAAGEAFFKKHYFEALLIIILLILSLA